MIGHFWADLGLLHTLFGVLVGLWMYKETEAEGVEGVPQEHLFFTCMIGGLLWPLFIVFLLTDED